MSPNNKFLQFTVTALKTSHLSINAQCDTFCTYIYSVGTNHWDLLKPLWFTRDLLRFLCFKMKVNGPESYKLGHRINFLQRPKHAWPYSDLLQALGEHLSALGFAKQGPQFLRPRYCGTGNRKCHYRKAYIFKVVEECEGMVWPTFCILIFHKRSQLQLYKSMWQNNVEIMILFIF